MNDDFTAHLARLRKMVEADSHAPRREATLVLIDAQEGLRRELQLQTLAAQIGDALLAEKAADGTEQARCDAVPAEAVRGLAVAEWLADNCADLEGGHEPGDDKRGAAQEWLQSALAATGGVSDGTRMATNHCPICEGNAKDSERLNTLEKVVTLHGIGFTVIESILILCGRLKPSPAPGQKNRD